MLASSLTGEGIDTLWDKLHELHETWTANGWWSRQRATQRLTAMHRHAKQLLVEQHMQSHQGLWEQQEERVAKGIEGPFSAARQWVSHVLRSPPTRTNLRDGMTVRKFDGFGAGRLVRLVGSPQGFERLTTPTAPPSNQLARLEQRFLHVSDATMRLNETALQREKLHEQQQSLAQLNRIKEGVQLLLDALERNMVRHPECTPEQAAGVGASIVRHKQGLA